MASAAGLFWSEVTTTRLISTFEKFIAGRAVVGRDGMPSEVFRMGFSSRAAKLREQVRAGNFRFSAYKQHLLLKGVGRAPRVVSIASVRDRLLLKSIANVLAATFPDARTPLAPEMIAGLVDELELKRYDSYVRIDVEEFYPHVRHQSVLGALTTKIRSRWLLNLVMSAVRTPTLTVSARRPTHFPCVGVPQGLPISNILAELSMAKLDRELSSFGDNAYFRYVDDVLLLCDKADVDTVKLRAVNGLLSIGLKAHPFVEGSKSSVGKLADEFGYLGYVFKGPRITVRASSVAKLEDSLTKVLTSHKKYISKKSSPSDQARALLRCELRLNLKITGCVYEGSRRGWMAFYSQIRHHQLLKHLDWYVDKQINRFNLTGQFVPKRFVSSYRFAATKRHDDTGFVPDFDNLTADEARDVLDKYFLMEPGELHRLSDQAIAEIFKRKMHRMVVELERDVSRNY